MENNQIEGKAKNKKRKTKGNNSKSKQTGDSWLLVAKVVASYQKQWSLAIPPQLIKQCVSPGSLCVPVCPYNLTNLTLISA